MKPWIHCVSSAKIFGGKPEDYLEIHNFLDSSKSAFGDNRHRALTHNAWFIGPHGPLERVFGVVITNSDGREVSVRDIGEQHIAEDFRGYIPTVCDYLQEMAFAPWMNNGKGQPPASQQLVHRKVGKPISGNKTQEEPDPEPNPDPEPEQLPDCSVVQEKPTPDVPNQQPANSSSICQVEFDGLVTAYQQAESDLLNNLDVVKLLTEAMQSCPDVRGVAWRQWTPFFNDGEPCLFTCNFLSVIFSEELLDNLIDDGNYCSLSDGTGLIANGLTIDSLEDPLRQTYQDQVQQLQAIFSRIPEVALHYQFGNDMTVIITRDGEQEVHDFTNHG